MGNMHPGLHKAVLRWYMLCTYTVVLLELCKWLQSTNRPQLAEPWHWAHKSRMNIVCKTMYIIYILSFWLITMGHFCFIGVNRTVDGILITSCISIIACSVMYVGLTHCYSMKRSNACIWRIHARTTWELIGLLVPYHQLHLLLVHSATCLHVSSITTGLCNE